VVGQLGAGYPHNRLLLSRRGASFSTRVKKSSAPQKMRAGFIPLYTPI